jgi:hypothetical protein
MQMSQKNDLLRFKEWQKLKTRKSQGRDENESSHFCALRNY